MAYGSQAYGAAPYAGELGGAAEVQFRATGEGQSDALVEPSVLPAFAAFGDGHTDAVVNIGFIQGGLAFGDGSADGTATFTIVHSTRVNNRVGGRRRLATAFATWEPAVVPAPAHLVEAEAVDRATAFGVPSIVGARPVYSVSRAHKPRSRHRITIGNHDVTYFRGIPTPHPSYQLVEPLLYGTARITLPQVHPAFEELGVGALEWCQPGKRVVIQRVSEGGIVDATDYIGVVIGLDTSDPKALVVEVGGEASGRAALQDRQLPIFWGIADVGRYAYGLIHDLGLQFKPHLGPTTGIRLAKLGGGMSMLDYAHELCARAWTRDGNQWSIMPLDPLLGGSYRMARKDTTTIHGTVYADDSRTVASLRRDVAEEPNRIFTTGVTPEGMRVRNGVYPGLRKGHAPAYPNTDGAPFGEGTTDASTDSGDGVSVMLNRLQVTGYLAQRDNPGGYDADATRAIKALQEEAADGPSFVDGIMNPETWDALFDLTVTGYSLHWSHIEPMAQDPRVRPWRRSSSGAVIARNPRYEPGRLKVDVSNDMGTGFDRDQMREWSKAELENSDAPNWVGTITFETGALVAGDHNPGDAITADDVMPARSLRPGMNLALPLFAGGIVVHVSGVNVNERGIVTAMVDTRARDAMKVWAIIARNREARKNPARLWLQEHRSSGMVRDSITEWDEIGGTIERTKLKGGEWNVLEVVAGQEGTVRKLLLKTTSPATEFVVAVFGQPIWPTRLERLIGNPLTKAGSRRWNREDVLAQLDEKNVLLYVAGDYLNPGGYYPKQKTAEGDQIGDGPSFVEFAPLTGRWEDDAQFSYHTFTDPVLYVAIFPKVDTILPAGRIMENQLAVGS